MFLSIDAGNSNIVFGFFDYKISKWSHEIRIDTRKGITSFELVKKLSLFFLENNLKPDRISQIGFSSVVPEVVSPIEDFCLTFFGIEPYMINGKSFEKLNVSTTRPNEIGTDLMANITAAYDHLKEGCIIVDFGTALTFSVVDDKGAVIGVNIVPGLKTAIKSLFTNTSKLPEVKLELPESAIGKNTVHAIQAGVLYGYAGLVKGMLQSIRAELNQDFKVIATGGLSKILTPLKDSFDEVDQNLTLKGIKLITEANQPKMA
ncbi:MAG: type III pantothenate kinase [Anditalea sp.]